MAFKMIRRKPAWEDKGREDPGSACGKRYEKCVFVQRPKVINPTLYKIPSLPKNGEKLSRSPFTNASYLSHI